MPTVKVGASTMLGEFEQAPPSLSAAAILTDEKAGTVASVCLGGGKRQAHVRPR
jgi:hypothetical protein